MTMQFNHEPALPRSRSFAFAVTLALALACSASFAEKPEGAGGGKGNKGAKHEQKHEQKQEQKQARKHDSKHSDPQDRQPFERRPSGKNSGNDQRASQVRVGGYFADQQRVVVKDYYGSEFRAGRCPPGLAKKNNGCMPPGQARKYTVGQRLPANVVYYQVPQRVTYQLGAPPSGYRYVRVASDILLLAVGTRMVVDAIQNLSTY